MYNHDEERDKINAERFKKQKSYRPTQKEYDPEDPHFNPMHPPRNTPIEVLEAFWGKDEGVASRSDIMRAAALPLGLRCDGYDAGHGYQFTDEVTGSTFYAWHPRQIKPRLDAVRRKFERG